MWSRAVTIGSETTYLQKIENMRADAAKIEAAAIAKEAQVDARIENNKFMRKELEKRMQESEKTRDELILASRKNANANSYINSAVRRVDSIQHTLDEVCIRGVAVG